MQCHQKIEEAFLVRTQCNLILKLILRTYVRTYVCSFPFLAFDDHHQSLLAKELYVGMRPNIVILSGQ